MMKTSIHIITLCGLLINSQIIAQVDEAQIIPFQAGAPARAADMNQNIQELITAINKNTLQLKALEDKMSIVASVTNLPQPTLQQELAGSVYRVGFFSVESGTGTDKIRQKIYVNNGTLTLKADGSLTLMITAQEREIDLHFIKITDPADNVIDAQIYKGDLPETENLNGTWSLTGNALTLTLGGDSEIFFVSMDGNTLFNSVKNTYNANGFNMFAANMRMGVRISKPQPNITIDVEGFGGGLEFNAVNNGASELTNDTNQKTVVIKNTGDADLVIGSSALIQEVGGDFIFSTQNALVVIPPNSEYRMLKLDNPLSQGSTRRDASVYIMTNDPDTPTFIINIHSTNNP